MSTRPNAATRGEKVPWPRNGLVWAVKGARAKVAFDTHAVAQGANARPGVSREEAQGLGSLLLPDRLGAWSWSLGYAAILTSLSVLRYHLWISTGFDLGLYEQGLWLILHEGLRAPTTYTGQPILARGAALLLLPLAPLYAVGGAGLLLALQSLALGMGYVLLRRLGRSLGVPDGTAHLVAVVYLFYPVVLGANLFDFHPVVFAVPALLAGFLAAVDRRPVPAILCWIVALMARDTVSLPVLCLGLVFMATGRWRVGLAAVVLSLAAAILDATVVLPWLTHASEPGAVQSLVRGLGIPQGARPGAWIRDLRAWEYLAWLIGPLMIIAMAARRTVLALWSLPALAAIAVNLMQDTAASTSPFNQFSLMVVPFAFTALVAGLSMVTVARRRRYMELTMAAAFLVVFAWHEVHTDWHAIPARADMLVTAARTIPPQAPVIAQNFTLPRLSNRPRAWLPEVALRDGAPAGTYILLDTGMNTGTTSPRALAAWMRLLSSHGWAKPILKSGRIGVWRLLRSLPALGGRT
jgi:uncharacterized membrane protein